MAKRRKSSDGGASGSITKSPVTPITGRCETRSMTATRSLTPSTPAAATDSPPKRRRGTQSTPATSTSTTPRRGRSAGLSAAESSPGTGGSARSAATGSTPRRGRTTPSTPAAATDSPSKRGRPTKAAATGSEGAATTGSTPRRGRSAGLPTPPPEPTMTKAKKGRKPKKEVGQGSTMAEEVLLGLKTEEIKTKAGEGSKKAETKESGEGSTMPEAEETGEGSKMAEIKETGEGSKMVETGGGSKMAEENTTEEEAKTAVSKGKAIAEVEETGYGPAAKPSHTVIIEYWTGHDLFVTRALEVKLALEEGAPGISVLLNPNGQPKPRCFKIQIVGGDTCIDFKKLEPPFTLLMKNDAQKFASNVLGRILPSN